MKAATGFKHQEETPNCSLKGVGNRKQTNEVLGNNENSADKESSGTDSNKISHSDTPISHSLTFPCKRKNSASNKKMKKKFDIKKLKTKAEKGRGWQGAIPSQNKHMSNKSLSVSETTNNLKPAIKQKNSFEDKLQLADKSYKSKKKIKSKGNVESIKQQAKPQRSRKIIELKDIMPSPFQKTKHLKSKTKNGQSSETCKIENNSSADEPKTQKKAKEGKECIIKPNQITSNETNVKEDAHLNKLMLSKQAPDEMNEGNENSKSLRCSLCGYESLNYNEAYTHKLWHTKPNMCAECDFRSDSFKDVLKHRMVKHLRCELCNNCFKSCEQLITHLKKYYNGVSYTCHCYFCQDTYPSVDDYKDHVLKEGRKSSIKISCNYCNMKICTINDLKEHTLSQYHKLFEDVYRGMLFMSKNQRKLLLSFISRDSCTRNVSKRLLKVLSSYGSKAKMFESREDQTKNE